MKNKYLFLALVPILILVELLLVSFITELVRQPSDIAVLIGIVLLCLDLAGNFLLIKLLISLFKTKTK
jgi:hypothetical protein